MTSSHKGLPDAGSLGRDPYADTSKVAWSMWLVPDDADARALTAVMRAIALSGAALPREERAQAAFPAFEPHVTVGFVSRDAGVERMAQLLDELAADTAPFRIDWAAVRTGPTYFQSLVLDARPAPELAALNARFQRAFGLADGYTPHLSLAYVDGVDAAALRALGDSVPTAFVRGGALMAALELWFTSGPVSSWYRLRAAPLSRGS